MRVLFVPIRFSAGDRNLFTPDISRPRSRTQGFPIAMNLTTRIIWFFTFMLLIPSILFQIARLAILIISFNQVPSSDDYQEAIDILEDLKLKRTISFQAAPLHFAVGRVFHSKDLPRTSLPADSSTMAMAGLIQKMSDTQ